MKLDGIRESDIMDSLNLNDNVSSIFKSGEGMGKSGSFFFFSMDQKFVIKTLRRDEKKILMDMLDDMIDHIKESPQSLLVRIYGIYTLKTKIFGTVDLILMENTF
jgi:1-phosphatidylinositol-4-phosphate 5-kinase